MTLWLTGLPAAGKTTLAQALVQKIRELGNTAIHLDGDEVRTGLCADLTFDPASRHENIRRVGHVAALLAANGLVAVASLVSPYRSDRAMVREIHSQRGLGFAEVFLDTPLWVCEQRDPRGLYASARRGDIDDLTGVDAPYEAPPAPEHRVEVGPSPAESAEGIVAALLQPA